MLNVEVMSNIFLKSFYMRNQSRVGSGSGSNGAARFKKYIRELNFAWPQVKNSLKTYLAI